jgi:hypothetical protein
MDLKTCDMPENIRDIEPKGMIQRAMWILDDVMGRLNVLDRIERVFTAIRFRDVGHQIALLRPTVGGNCPQITAGELLREYGIPVWGRTHDSKCMYFHVKRRQMKWAHAILKNRGVIIVDKRSGRIIYQSGGGSDRYIPWKEGGSKARQAEPKRSTAQRVAGWFK